MSESVRARNFMLLLYPDDKEEGHQSVILMLTNYNAVWIEHDKDLGDDGQPKKRHIHAILCFHNARYLSGVCKELGLSDRWVRPVGNLRLSMGYLIHSNDKTKHQYKIDDLQGNVDLFRKTTILRRDICDTLPQIFAFIESDVKCNMRKVYHFCMENDLLDVYISKNQVIKNFLVSGLVGS